MALQLRFAVLFTFCQQARNPYSYLDKDMTTIGLPFTEVMQ